MSVEHTCETLITFLQDLGGHGPFGRHFAPDVRLLDLHTGQIVSGREAVERNLRYLHAEAFDARLAITATVVDDEHASLQADFVGRHTGAFGGVAPTGRAVDVPCDLTLYLRDGTITALAEYVPLDRLMQQVRAEP